MLSQIRQFKSKYPGAKWFAHDPLPRQNIRDGLRAAMGGEFEPTYNFSKASVIVSIDCDFLFEEPGHGRYSRDLLMGGAFARERVR